MSEPESDATVTHSNDEPPSKRLRTMMFQINPVAEAPSLMSEPESDATLTHSNDEPPSKRLRTMMFQINPVAEEPKSLPDLFAGTGKKSLTNELKPNEWWHLRALSSSMKDHMPSIPLPCRYLLLQLLAWAPPPSMELLTFGVHIPRSHHVQPSRVPIYRETMAPPTPDSCRDPARLTMKVNVLVMHLHDLVFHAVETLLQSPAGQPQNRAQNVVLAQGDFISTTVAGNVRIRDAMNPIQTNAMIQALPPVSQSLRNLGVRGIRLKFYAYDPTRRIVRVGICSTTTAKRFTYFFVADRQNGSIDNIASDRATEYQYEVTHKWLVYALSRAVECTWGLYISYQREPIAVYSSSSTSSSPVVAPTVPTDMAPEIDYVHQTRQNIEQNIGNNTYCVFTPVYIWMDEETNSAAMIGQPASA